MENKDKNSNKDLDKQNKMKILAETWLIQDKTKILFFTNEVEIDAEGNKVIVQRARNVDGINCSHS
jgi:hypothetical protein